ncbi:MAG: N-acetylneuraminate synthase family protein [Lachnospiraceae bacterium]|nr:N-acetylneuraminate synthase family protein [Lachnospiraceae bacterium]
MINEKKPYLIAEIGVNFYDTARVEGISLIEAAKKYIKGAASAGVDAVKFQSYKANTLASKNSPAYWDLTKEPTNSQYELFSRHDCFGQQEFVILKDYCDEIGVDFLSTPFDYKSADYLDDLMKIYKISSSDLSNLPFIRHIASKGKPIYLSVGASYISEVEEAVRAIRDVSKAPICLLHCVLSYPCKYEDANLAVIKTLAGIFPDCLIGYSDHTLPDENMTVLSTAYLFGAQVIEKHFTLDKSLTGNDHYHAGDVSDFKKAVANFALIDNITGDSEKTVLACETVPRKEARRSLVLTRDMKEGEVIAKADITAKRPGTGISPRYADIVIGRKVRKDLPEDTILAWENV